MRLIPHQQHDPDDEPVAPPLDPEFFEFDRTFLLLYYLLSSKSHLTFFLLYSSQGRYQPRTTKRTTLR